MQSRVVYYKILAIHNPPCLCPLYVLIRRLFALYTMLILRRVECIRTGYTSVTSVERRSKTSCICFVLYVCKWRTVLHEVAIFLSHFSLNKQIKQKKLVHSHSNRSLHRLIVVVSHRVERRRDS